MKFKTLVRTTFSECHASQAKELDVHERRCLSPMHSYLAEDIGFEQKRTNKITKVKGESFSSVGEST
jgi:hypothetical protein